MADGRHHGDTLFIVCEDNFRLYESDGLERHNVSAAHAPEAPLGADLPQDSVRSRIGSVPYSQRGAGPDRAAEVGRYVSGTKPKGGDDGGTQELQDIVRHVTAAHRVKRGDFVWLSWGSDEDGKQLQPVAHSTCIAVSHDGANWLNRHWDTAVPREEMTG